MPACILTLSPIHLFSDPLRYLCWTRVSYAQTVCREMIGEAVRDGPPIFTETIWRVGLSDKFASSLPVAPEAYAQLVH